MTVYGQLFGEPQIFLNGEPVFFPFSKIDALLYYLFVNKRVTRDEIAMLLWPDMEDKNAKKNLRNVIYQANKILGENYIESPNRTTLVLSETLPIDSDVKQFMQDPRRHLALYQGEFLKGFHFKDSDEYDLWLVKMRNYFERQFMNETMEAVEESFETNNFETIEQDLHRLIALDEFDETNYQMLMKYHQKMNRHDKVIELYYNLSDVLNDELGVAPNLKTREFFEQSISELNRRTPIVSRRFTKKFFGRLNEIQWLEQNFLNFDEEESAYSVVVRGEEGIGKTSLINRVLDNIDPLFYIIDTQCYEVEIDYNLRPWYRFLVDLTEIIKDEKLFDLEIWYEILAQHFPSMDLKRLQELNKDKAKEHYKFPTTDFKNIDQLAEIIAMVIRMVTQDKKMVCVFSDIQWMDDESFKLLTNVMFQLKNEQALFMFTLRTDLSLSLNANLSTLRHYNLIYDLKLEPLTLSEVGELAHGILPGEQLSEEKIQDLYDLTEGNLFFLEEALKMLKADQSLDILTIEMKSALKERFNGLNDSSWEVLKVISYFYDPIFLDFLKQFMDMTDEELAQIISPLVKETILTEGSSNGEITVGFSHRRYREYVYQMESLVVRQAGHYQIAEKLLDYYKNVSKRPIVLSKIAKHYESAGHWIEAIDFKLQYLECFLEFYHELFPVEQVPAHPISKDFELTGVWGRNVERMFSTVRENFDDLEYKYHDQREFSLLKIRFCLMNGRYAIRKGAYDVALQDIVYVIQRSDELQETRFLLEGYKQMIYYYIQINEAHLMHDYLEKALGLAVQANNYESMGILLRLEGLYYIMTGQLDLAESRLKESIRTFTITDMWRQKYSVSVAVAYDYLAEIACIRQLYDESIELEETAIKLVEASGVKSTLYVFHINMGIILFHSQKYQEALAYFEQAYLTYQEIPTSWKSAQLFSYLILVNYLLDQKDLSYILLTKLDKRSNHFDSQIEYGFLAYMRALIAEDLERKDEKDTALGQSLARPSQEYYEEAKTHLSPLRNVSELRVLDQVFKQGYSLAQRPLNE